MLTKRLLLLCSVSNTRPLFFSVAIMQFTYFGEIALKGRDSFMCHTESDVSGYFLVLVKPLGNSRLYHPYKVLYTALTARPALYASFAWNAVFLAPSLSIFLRPDSLLYTPQTSASRSLLPQDVWTCHSPALHSTLHCPIGPYHTQLYGNCFLSVSHGAEVSSVRAITLSL